jgi:DNA modification methylase
MSQHEQPAEGTAAAEWVAVERLIPWVKNPRKNDATVDKLAEGIRAHGWGAPILARRDNGEIIAGHTRLKAALRLGLKVVPVRYLDLDEIRAHSLALADNRIGEDSEWDREALARILVELKDAEADLDATGFDEKEVEDLIAKLEAERLEDIGEDLDEDLLTVPDHPVSLAGEVYRLGPHRLVCGDSTVLADVECATEGAPADLLFTDPPYGVSYLSRGGPRSAHKEGAKFKAIENDDLTPEHLETFLVECLSAACALMRPGAAAYVFHADQKPGIRPAFERAFIASGFHLAATLIWVKDNASMGWQDYRGRHEPILYGWREGGERRKVEDRTETTLWEISRDGPTTYVHPTQKPTALSKRAVKNSTRVGDLVLDLFGGSGSTLIGAAMAGRRAAIVEKDPGYCDVIRRRWARFALKAGLEVGDGIVGEQKSAASPASPRIVPALPAPLEVGGPPDRLKN